MHPIHTFEDLIHAVTSSLSLISSYSQLLMDQRARSGDVAKGEVEELQAICDEAARAATLLSMIPQGLMRRPFPCAPRGGERS